MYYYDRSGKCMIQENKVETVIGNKVIAAQDQCIVLMYFK